MGPRSLITGSSTWKTRADFLSQSLLHQSQQTNISQAASLWKMKKVKIGRAAAPPDRKLLKRGPACECRSVHAGGASKGCPLWVKSGHVQRTSHVRFTPKSGHSVTPIECPLCANSGHRTLSLKRKRSRPVPRPSKKKARLRGEAGLMITLRARPKRRPKGQGLGLR